MKQLLLCLVLVAIQHLVLAQDTHYWSNQFGARASFLGGAVIAGTDDNSAVYYNPANLAFIKHNSIALNASVYKYDDVFIGNGAGTGQDLKSQKISLYQQMISGLLTKNPESPLRVGFNILARQNSNLDMSLRHEGPYDIIQDTLYTGGKYYIGNLDLQNALNETWVCLGAGYRIGDHFSVGLTAIATYRNQQHTFSYTGRSFNASAFSPAVLVATNHSYVHTRTNIIGGLLKAGFHGRIGDWKFGLNVTSPSLTIWGESRGQREDNQSNRPDSTAAGGYTDRVRTEDQKQMPSKYKYPLSIGTGISYKYKTGVISLSAEYFMAIPEYTMIDPSGGTSSTYSNQASNQAQDFLTVKEEAKQVLNWAIGWKQKLVEKLDLHLGFRTDFSYTGNRNPLYRNNGDETSPSNRPETNLKIIRSNINLWHFSGGIAWHRKQSLMSFGVDYAYGHRGRTKQLINFTDPLVEGKWFLFGKPDDSAYLNYHSITLLIGYTYFFALK